MITNPVHSNQNESPNQIDQQNEQIQLSNQQIQDSSQQIQIQLDYDELIKYHMINNKKSNVLIRLVPDDMQQMKIKKNNKKKKKKKKHNQIDTKDLKDIVIIILLVLILTVSIFRVVLEVQIQYKKAQQLFQLKQNNHSHISEESKNSHLSQSNYQKINQQSNNPNQNQDQYGKAIFNQPNTQIKNTEIKKQPEITITLTPQCQQHINTVIKSYGDLYDFKLPYQYFSQKSKVNTYVENKNTKISRQQYSQAVSLLGIVHKINPNGNLILQKDPCQSQQIKKQRIQKVMTQQFDRWNSQYQIDFYYSKQLPFCLVVNSYNNAHNGLIYRNIDSILQQNYTNYHVIYTDDFSNDQTGSKVKGYLEKKNIPESQIKVIINPSKYGMMKNIYTAVHQYCVEGQIVVMIDGDDSLIGTNVLSLLNAVYQSEKPAVIWTNFLCIFTNSQASIGFSRDYTDAQKSSSSFRRLKGFITSHLKTFFVDIFRKIKQEDLQTNDGKFYGGASDTAMMLPMIQMANPRIKYLSQILYEYRYDTGQTGNVVNKIPQKQALRKIFSSKNYQKIQDFTFIQKAIQNSLSISLDEIQMVDSLSLESKEQKISDTKI